MTSPDLTKSWERWKHVETISNLLMCMICIFISAKYVGRFRRCLVCTLMPISRLTIWAGLLRVSLGWEAQDLLGRSYIVLGEWSCNQIKFWTKVNWNIIWLSYLNIRKSTLRRVFFKIPLGTLHPIQHCDWPLNPWGNYVSMCDPTHLVQVQLHRYKVWTKSWSNVGFTVFGTPQH